MKPHNPEIEQTKLTEGIDWLAFKLRVIMAAGVAPERIATMLGEIESGKQPDLYAANIKYRKAFEERIVTQLKVTASLTQPLIAALDRNDLTTSEFVFLHKTLAKYSAGQEKILALAENVYPTEKTEKH